MNSSPSTRIIYFIAIEGRSGHLENVYQFQHGIFKIGRSPTCHIILSSLDVSREHAILTATPKGLTIEDTNSKGGIYVDGIRIQGLTAITSDSKIQLGPYRIHIDTKVTSEEDPTIQESAGKEHFEYFDWLAPTFGISGDFHDSATKILLENFQTGFASLYSATSMHTAVAELIAEDAAVEENSQIEKIAPKSLRVLTGTEPEDLSDTLFDRYERIRPLAECGYGSIWVVREKLSRRYVALKVLKNEYLMDKEMVSQFMVESMITAQMQHPNILPVYDIGFLEHNQLYYTMRLVEGARIKQVLIDNIHQRRSIYILMQVASAIAYAHKQNLMHLDLKPANLLIDDNDHCYVTDWGLVREIPGFSYKLEPPKVILPYMQNPRGVIKKDSHHNSYDNDRLTTTMRRMKGYFGNRVVGT